MSNSSSNLISRLRTTWGGDHGVFALQNEAADEIEQAKRIMRRAISWLQIKEAAFSTHKGPAIIEEMQRFVAGSSVETSDNAPLRAALAEWDRWSAKAKPRDVPFNEVLTHRGKAVEGLIAAARAAVGSSVETAAPREPPLFTLQLPPNTTVLQVGDVVEVRKVPPKSATPRPGLMGWAD